MNEIHPPLQGLPLVDPSRLQFPSQLLQRASKCTGRSLVVRHQFSLLSESPLEHRLIEALRHVWTILICHRPHSPCHTPEPTILHCSCHVQALFSRASLGQLSSVTGRKEGKFGSRKSRPHNLEQRETLLIKLKSGVKWFSGLQCAVANKMGKLTIQEAI